jgi:hypothetical protein
MRGLCVSSILLGLWLGFGNKSFDSATSSAVAEAAATSATPKYKTVAIREIQPAGYKVLADNPQTPGQAAGDFGEFDPNTWRVHRFLMSKPNGGWLKIGLARPVAWIESVERNDSGQVWLEFEELGIADWATLQGTESCPSDILGEGRLVTGTFEHSSGEVLNLYIAGEATPIGSTANHPFWSEDRQDFVQAGSLNPGEHLRLADGRTTTLQRTEPIAEQLPVYNLEVDGEHVYFVGESGVLVHNAHRYQDSIDVHVGMAKPSQKHLLNLPRRPGRSPKFNRMNDDIYSGHAPRTIERVDKGGGVRGEQPHVHFDDGNALNIDGSWKHGEGRPLTGAEIDWLTSHFWPVP